MEQKVCSCLNVKEEVHRLEKEQRSLHSFVQSYNQQTIDETKKIRVFIADTNQALQKQLNKHMEILESYRPRI